MQNYFNYFTEIEERFQQRRGAILLLSTLDWALIETWRDAGIPLEAALRGIDGLVFTAGIGENSAEVRRRVCEASAWLGLELDLKANASGGPRISTPHSKVSAWVVPTNEELMIARHTGSLLGLVEPVLTT